MKALISSILIIICISCSKSKKANFDNQLNVPLSSNISSLDPAIAFDAISYAVLGQVYETLYEYDYNSEKPKIIPLLAESLPLISDDQLTYTFKIKKNIFYHSHPSISKERTVKAQDFVNQIKRLAYTPLKGQGFFLFEGKVKGIDDFKKNTKNFNDLLSKSIQGVKVINDHEFSIELVKPYPQMLYAMTMIFTTPLPEETLRATNNLIDSYEIGTGPYTLKTFKRSHKVVLEKFESYHDKRFPKIKTIHLPFMKESQTQWLNFLNKKIDFFGLGKDHYNLALNKKGFLKDKYQDKGLKLVKSSSLTYWWFAYNMKDSIFSKNKNLRLAFAHAIDRKKFIELFTNNTGELANSIYHPFLFGYDKNQKPGFSHDIEKAKFFLEKAGFKNGKGLKPITMDLRSSNSESLQQGEFIKNQLSKIGVNINIQTNTFSAFLRKAREGKLQFWLDGWHLDYPDSENILQLLSNSNHPPGVNSTYYNSPKFEELFSQLKITPDGQKKQNLMKQIEAIIQEDQVWSMLFYSRSIKLYNDRVKNYKPSPLINNFFKHLSL